MPRMDDQYRSEEQEQKIRRRQFRFRGFVIGLFSIILIVLLIVFALSYLLR